VAARFDKRKMAAVRTIFDFGMMPTPRSVFQAAAWAMIGFNLVELLADIALGDFHIITVLEIHP
jgi:hypothetical protein